MTRTILVLSLVGLVSACAGGPQRPSSPLPAAPPEPTIGVEEAAATITPEDMHDRTAYLASDEMGGRDTPSPGLEMAATWIADEFGAFGLDPAGDDGTFIQRFPWTRTSLDPERTQLRFEIAGNTATPVYARDFFLIPGGSETASGGLVWGGTAQPGMEPLGSDAADRIAVVFIPGAAPDGAWNASLIAAMGAAMPAGVAGLVFVLDPEFDSGMVGQIAQVAAGQSGAPLPLIGITWDAMNAALAAGGEDLQALTQGGFRVLDAGTATLAFATASEEFRPPNVVGLLPGSDPELRDQYVVFSAHIDHVGFGAPDAQGDSIFNGADDDASGTATMMEVAEAFSALTVAPRRSLLFLGVSGEEKGLLGSAYFVDNPPVGEDQMIANINLDMVGRNAPDTVVAIGQDYSSLGPLVQEVSAARPELGLVVAPDLWPEENLFVRSDHFNFARAGVAALFFTTGLHDQYHQPSDEIDLIDSDKMSRIGKLAFYLAYEIANADGVPEWTEEGRRVVAEAGGG
jgi:hypothetical protein